MKPVNCSRTDGAEELKPDAWLVRYRAVDGGSAAGPWTLHDVRPIAKDSVYECIPFRVCFPANMRECDRASAQSIAGVQSGVDSIPPNVYWAPLADNFYSAEGGGMGVAFYRKWKSRRAEFPQGEAWGFGPGSKHNPFKDPPRNAGVKPFPPLPDAEYKAWCAADERRMLGRPPLPGDAELLGRTHEELERNAGVPVAPKTVDGGM